MIDASLLLILPLALAAFFLKGIATFGAGVVLVPLGALLIGTKEVVLLIAILDLISNAFLYRPRKKHFRDPFLIAMTVFMVIGVLTGALILKHLQASQFDIMFAMILIPLGIWMMVTTLFNIPVQQRGQAPTASSKLDRSISLVSGCMGGVLGLTGPVLAWYLSRRYSKQVFRDMMIPLLLVSACARILLYSATGVFDSNIFPVVLVSLPGLVIGIWLGNRLFFRVQQKWFDRIVGGLITVSGIKLLSR